MNVPSKRTTKWIAEYPKFLVIVFCMSCLTETSWASSAAEEWQLSLSTVNYEKAELIEAYNSSPSFEERGMEGLYVVTDFFLNGIQPKNKPLPKGFTDNFYKNELRYLSSNYSEVVLYHIGIVITCAIGITLALLIPCIGFFCCCCRCMGKCGGKVDPMEKKRDRYRRISLTVTLAFFTLLMMFGLICAFVTNEYMDQSLHQLPSRTKTHLQDFELYLNNTELEVHQLLIVNFQQLHNYIESSLMGAGRSVKIELGKVSKIIHIIDLQNIVNGLENISKNLDIIENSTRNLQQRSVALLVKLNNISLSYLEVFKQLCFPQSVSPCSDLHEEAAKLNKSTDFMKLPNVSSQARTIKNIIDKDVMSKLKEAISKYDSIETQVQENVNKSISVVNQHFDDVGGELAKQDRTISNYMKQINFNSLSKGVDQANFYIDEYGIYRWYAGITISCIVLLIVLAFIIAILFGICGKRPGNVYGDNTCNKGVGATFLLIANGLIIFFYFYLMIVISVLFLAGIFTTVYVCRSLDHPSTSQELKVLDNYMKIGQLLFNNDSIKLPIGDVLQNCHENKAIYQVLHLENIFNISDINSFVNKYNLDQEIKRLFENINVNLSNKFLDEETDVQLTLLANSHLSEINFVKFAEELKTNLTAINLNYYIMQVKSYTNDLSEDTEGKKQLDLITKSLEDTNNNMIAQMYSEIKILNTSLKALEQGIKFNETSLSDAVIKFKTKILKAQDFINITGAQYIRNLTIKLANRLKDDVNGYMKYCINEISDHVGQCKPVSIAINSTVGDVCKAVLSPFNGFWISIGYILILFIPSMAISYVLVGLYRKSDPYPGILVETDFNSYHSGSYADRDTIPLAQVDKHKHPDHQGIVNPNGMYDCSRDSNTWMDDYRETPQNRYSKAFHNQPVGNRRNDFQDWGYRNGSHLNNGGHNVGNHGYEVYPMDATRPAYFYPGPDYN